MSFFDSNITVFFESIDAETVNAKLEKYATIGFENGRGFFWYQLRENGHGIRLHKTIELNNEEISRLKQNQKIVFDEEGNCSCAVCVGRCFNLEEIFASRWKGKFQTFDEFWEHLLYDTPPISVSEIFANELNAKQLTFGSWYSTDENFFSDLFSAPSFEIETNEKFIIENESNDADYVLKSFERTIEVDEGQFSFDDWRDLFCPGFDGDGEIEFNYLNKDCPHMFKIQHEDRLLELETSTNNFGEFRSIQIKMLNGQILNIEDDKIEDFLNDWMLA